MKTTLKSLVAATCVVLAFASAAIPAHAATIASTNPDPIAEPKSTSPQLTELTEPGGEGTSTDSTTTTPPPVSVPEPPSVEPLGSTPNSPSEGIDSSVESPEPVEQPLDDVVIDDDGYTVFGQTPLPTLEPYSSTSTSEQYIIAVADAEVLDEIVTELASSGIDITNSWHGALNGFSARLNTDVGERLRERSGVLTVERDDRIELEGVQAGAPWNLDRVDQRSRPLDSRYMPRDSGAGVTAYVIDSGIRVSHTEFAGRVTHGAYYDFGDNTGIQDCNGHGTHVAGTIGGTTWGVAKSVSIVPVKAFRCDGATSESILVGAMNFVINDHDPGESAVVNMSLGGPASSALDSAVRGMINDGITVVVAAGNDAMPTCNVSPARVAEAITVAASTAADDDAAFSNYGACNDLFAPGVGITSASYLSDTGSQLMDGTSMAAPHVAGAAALVLEVNPSATPAQVWATIDAATTRGAISECCGDPDKLLYVQPLTVPGAPTIAQVATGNGSITVAVNPSTTGGSPITGYKLEVRSGSTVVSTTTSTQPTLTITGLTRGATYTVLVAASNIVGQSAWSAPSSATLPDLPGAPTIAQVATGNGSITVVVNPSTTGGSPITGYKLEVRSGSVVVSTTTSTQPTLTITGLTRGATYTVLVAASNIVGQSAWSAPSSATLPDLPGAPTIKDAVGYTGRFLGLHITPPADPAESITAYVVQVRSGTTVVATQTSNETSVIVYGLTAGETYTVTAAAVNIIGQSPWSAPASVLMPNTVPMPPTIESTTAGDGTLAVTLTPPSDTGGVPLSSYTVEVDRSYPPSVVSQTSTESTITFTGLTRGADYYVLATANNALGQSQQTYVTVTLPDVPAPPTFSVTAGDRSVVVSLTAPTFTGHSPITGYKVQVSEGSTVVATRTSTDPTISVAGLTRGATYSVAAAATNAIGQSEWSTTTHTLPDVPSAPNILYTSPGDRSVVVSLTAPTFTGHSPITGYKVQVSEGSTVVATKTSTDPTISVAGLTRGATYSVAAAATNAIGQSEWSTTTVTLPDVPSVPTIADVSSDGFGWTVTVASPPATDGTSIVEYNVEVRDGSNVVATYTSPGRFVHVAGLTHDASYTLAAAATNGIGRSAWGPTTSATFPKTFPAPPTISRLTAGVNSLTVNLTAPADTGGLPIAGYTVFVWGGQGAQDVTSTTATIVVSGLQPGGTYYVMAHAFNAIGHGGLSSQSTVTLLSPPPPTSTPSATYLSLSPARLLDTRVGMTTVDGLDEASGPRPGGSVTQLQVSGRGGVPLSAVAVVLNVTVTEPEGAGYVTVLPCGPPVPTASNLNFSAGQTTANAVIATTSLSGTVCLYTSAPTHLIADVNGYFPPGSRFGTLSPGRLLDSRPGQSTVDGQFSGIGLLTSGSVTELVVAGRAGVPNDAATVALNVTATEAHGAGFVTVFGCGSRPNASNLNYTFGQTVPNAVVAQVSSRGTICLYTSTHTHLVVDVNGYFPRGTDFGTLSPGRLMDTRVGQMTVDGQFNGIGARPSGSVTELTVTGRSGVPMTASTVTLNVTVTQPQVAGYVTVFPCGSPLPNASNVNYVAGQTVPNLVIAKVGAGGKVCLYNSSTTHLIADVNGWL